VVGSDISDNAQAHASGLDNSEKLAPVNKMLAAARAASQAAEGKGNAGKGKVDVKKKVRQQVALAAKKLVALASARLKLQTKAFRKSHKKEKAATAVVKKSTAAWTQAKAQMQRLSNKLKKGEKRNKQFELTLLAAKGNTTGKAKTAQQMVKLRKELFATNVKLKATGSLVLKRKGKMNQAIAKAKPIKAAAERSQKKQGMLKQSFRDAEKQANLLQKDLADDATCPVGAKRGADPTKCFYEVFCPRGARRQGEGCVVDVTCPEGSSRSGNKCIRDAVSCPAGAIEKVDRNGKSCHWPLKCPNGTSLDSKKKRCIRPALPVECPKGTSRAGKFCVLPKACPYGTVQKGENCVNKKTVCPKGSIEHNGTCFVLKMNCPKGSTDVAGICYQSKVNCPPGSRKQRKQCVSSKIRCPSGTSRIKGTSKPTCEVDTCPKGASKVKGVCVGRLACPKGSVSAPKWPGMCLKPTVCPEATKRVGGKCVAEFTCSGSAILRNGKCILPAVCPPNSNLEGGECVQHVVQEVVDAKQAAKATKFMVGDVQSLGLP